MNDAFGRSTRLSGVRFRVLVLELIDVLKACAFHAFLTFLQIYLLIEEFCISSALANINVMI